MSWSTRELSELAGTTVRAIRHYHHVGILPEPSRASNGYKQYELPHLVRLLQIRRLMSIGMTLAQVQEALDDPGQGVEMLDVLDRELQTQIDRLQQAQSEVRLARSMQLPPQFPTKLVTQFGMDVDEVTEGEAQLVFLLSQIDSRVLDEDSAIIEDSRLDSLSTRFRHLPAEASLKEREELAAAISDVILPLLDQHPSVWDSTGSSLAHEKQQEHVVDLALHAYLNPAQVWVMNNVICEGRKRRDEKENAS